MGLRDDHVAARYRPASVGLFLGATLALLLFWLPFAALGVLFNWIPYQAVRLVASRSGSRGPARHLQAARRLRVLPRRLGVEALVAGVALGPLAALAVLVLAPATGHVAMRFHERYEHLIDESAAYVLRVVRRRSLRELRADRAAFRSELDRLAALDQAARDAEEKPGDPR